MLYQHNPASSLPSLRLPPSLVSTAFFYFKLNKRLFTHPRGLKNAWALRRNGLVTYDSWTVFWGKKGCEAFFFVNQASESCKEGIQYRVSLFAYFTWRQSSDDLRSPWETVGSHRNAHKKKKNVCRCNRVHSRQTHAVTFWLCSSIVVAIFVTFLKLLAFFSFFFENKDI